MVNESRLIDDFIELVSISSPSLKERPVMSALEGKVRAAGFDPTFDNAGMIQSGEIGNLFFRIPRNTTKAVPIFLNAHVDTVVPCDKVTPIQDNGVIRTDGTSVLGGDDKTGVMTILEAVRAVKENDLPHGDIEVCFTIAEEIGLLGAYAFDVSRLKSKMAFVFDGGTPIGRVVNSAPSQVNLAVKVKGRAAHAGVSPEKGVSAIILASKAIARMKLLRIDPETTANVGMIRGGLATNIVTENVEVVCEARSRSEEKLASQVAHMRECFEGEARAGGGDLEIVETRKYTRYNIAETADILRIFRAACDRMGTEVRLEPSGGGSDANVWNEKDLESVVVNCGQQNVHTLNECVDTADLIRSAKLCVEIIRAACDE